MVGRRLEDGVKVDGGDAEIGQVVQLVLNPLQVATKEVAAQGPFIAEHTLVGAAIALGQVIPVLDQHRVVIDGQVPGLGVDLGVTIVETVGVELVDDGVFHPVGGHKSGVVDVDLEAVVGRVVVGQAPTTVEQIVVLVIVLVGTVADDEAVVEDGQIVLSGDGGLPPVVAVGFLVGGGNQLHGIEGLGTGCGAPDTDDDLGDVVVVGAEAKGDRDAGGDCGARHAVKVVPRVVAQAVPPDVVVGARNRWGFLHRHLHPPSEGVQHEGDVLIGYGCPKGCRGGVDTAPVGANGIPGAGLDRFVLVGTGAGDGGGQRVHTIPLRRHGRRRIGVVPALPVAHGGPGAGLGADTDDVGLRQPAVGVGIGVKGDRGDLVSQGRVQPAIARGGVAVRPVLGSHLEFVPAGCGNGDQGGVDAVAGRGIAMRAIIEHRVRRAPAVKVAHYVPVRRREQGKGGQGRHVRSPVRIGVGHVGVAGHGVLGVAAPPGGEQLQSDGSRVAKRRLGHAVLDPVLRGPVALLAPLGDEAVVAPAGPIPVVELDIL